MNEKKITTTPVLMPRNQLNNLSHSDFLLITFMQEYLAMREYS